MNRSQIDIEAGATTGVETVIIGAGQAGLATGYHLQRRGRPFLILEGNDRIGDGWRRQWDTLRLYTPVKYDGLLIASAIFIDATVARMLLAPAVMHLLG